MRIVVLLLLTIGLAISSSAQNSFTRDLWLNDVSAPVKTNAMLQDSNGYIWMGTDDGLYRFNGRSFTLIPDSIRKPVTALAINGRTVIVGYANGDVGIVDDNVVRLFPIKGDKPVTTITSIIAGEDGLLWISTEGQGFVLVIGNQAVSCNTRRGLSDDYVYNLFIFPNRRIVASTDQGIDEVYFDRGKLTINKLSTKDGLPDNIVRVIKPMPDGTPCWLGTEDGGLGFYCRKNRVVWTPYIKGGWQWGPVNDILPMANGRAWVATENGYLLDVTTTDGDTLIVNPHYFPGKKMRKVLIGRSGIIWCATNQGLTVLADEYMQYLQVPPPYNVGDVRAMTIDRNNKLWYALDNRLFSLSLSASTPMTHFVYQAPTNITSLFADESGRLWIGSFGKGLFYRNPKGNTHSVTNIPQLVNESVLDVSGTKNELWVSGLNGVEELAYPTGSEPLPKFSQLHNKRSGVGSDYVYQVYPDRQGNIWFATDGGGLCQYRNGKYKLWSQATGLGSTVIYNVCEDAKGNIWAVTLGNGLFCYDGNKWSHFSTKDGLQDLNISTIAANATGQVVIVHGKGFDVWYPGSHQFRNYVSNKQGYNIDTVSQVLKLSAVDAAGNVYIPFQAGFLVVKNINTPYDIRPSISIQSVSVFLKPVKQQSFDYDENQLSFKYEGVNFANPEKLHYRYKLEGYNSNWIETNDEIVTFPQLPPGGYTFKVQVSLNNSFSGATEASYQFMIASPFWKRWWFLALVAIFIFGFVYLYIRWREQNLKKLSSLQSERMLFEYEHLKSQVNPHFLFNSLNTLASLIEEDKHLATDYTTHLSDFYRNMLAYRNKDLVPLSEEWSILQNYLYIQQSRFGNALQLKINVYEYIMKSRRIVPLSLQLLVENAIKHNVVSKATPLIITITASDDKITVRNNLNLKMSKEKGSGLGLANIKKRYNLLTDKNIYIGVSDSEYTVILPLL